MTAILRSLSLWTLTVFSLVSCGTSSSKGSDGDSSTSGAGTIPASISTTYCTATVKAKTDVLPFLSTGSYGGTGSTIDAGSTVAFTKSFSGNGIEVMSYLSDTLVKGDTSADNLTSTCDLANLTKLTQDAVVSHAGSLFATKELTSTGCHRDVGTTIGNAGLAYVSSTAYDISQLNDDVKAKCGFNEGYTHDLDFFRVYKK